MNEFEKLAQTLEEAARQLRIAGRAMDAIPPFKLLPLPASEFSVRTMKALRRHGVTTVQALERSSAEDLLEIKNFGMTSLSEVRKFLASQGKALFGDEQPYIG